MWMWFVVFVLSVVVDVKVDVPREIAERLKELSEEDRRLILALFLLPKSELRQLSLEEVEELTEMLDRRIKADIAKRVLDLLGRRS